MISVILTDQQSNWKLPSTTLPEVTREEFEALKKDFEELKELLRAAKKYDTATNQPDCEMEDKVEALRKVAKFLGVTVDDIFPKKDEYAYAYVTCGRKGWPHGNLFMNWEKISFERHDFTEDYIFRIARDKMTEDDKILELRFKEHKR